MATLSIDEHEDARPITRASFIEAYVDANPYKQCEHAWCSWKVLHLRDVLSDEIDEDPS